MPEQPNECMKHHMLLKKMLDEFKEEFGKWKNNCDKIQCFFFGGMHQAEKGELSFVDKVNTMYDNQRKSRQLLISFVSVFGVLFITSLVGLGVQINKLDSTVNTLAGVVEKQQNIEIEIAKINARIVK